MGLDKSLFYNPQAYVDRDISLNAVKMNPFASQPHASSAKAALTGYFFALPAFILLAFE